MVAALPRRAQPYFHSDPELMKHGIRVRPTGPGAFTDSVLLGTAAPLSRKLTVPTSGAAFVAASNGSGSISYTPPANGWGTHTLYVEAADNAGNISAPAQYSFYVPWNPSATVTAGDINGDGIPDLLTTDSAGDLVEYPGNSDPSAAPVTVS